MTKFSKKVISLAVASFVTVSSAFGGNYSAKAATVQAQETTAKEQTYTVHFKMPSTWKGSTTPNIYSYYVSDTEIYNGQGALKEPSKKWPGTAMTKDTTDKTGKWYTSTVTTTVGYAKVVFLSDAKETPAYRTPEEKDALGNKKDGYTISSDVWFDLDTMTQPSTSDPTATATPTPTKTPTASPSTAPTATPISGPQVVADKPSGTSYYEEDSDTLSVNLKLAGGATKASYFVDNGPVKTITGSAVVKVGQGKMAHNTPITLTVISTNGKESNTQTFTYNKRSKVAEKYNLKTTSLSQSMVELFSTVETAATKTTSKEITVNFTAPTTWLEKDTVYAYAYYDKKVSKNGTVETVTEKPLGAWPGKKATKNANGTYSTTFTSETGEARIIFASIKDGKVGALVTNPTGDDYYASETVAQAPNGFELGEDGKPLKDEHGNWIPVNGYYVNENISLTTSGSGDNVALVPVTTPTATPSTTPVVTTPPTATPAGIDGFFGTEKSAPQYNTTKQKLRAQAVNKTGDVTYTFIVDNKVLYEGPNNNVEWNPSNLAAGNHTIVVTMKDKVSSKSIVKSYTLETVEPSTTPTVSTTPAVSATPVATVTPSAVPTVTPSTAPTNTPPVVIIPTPSPVPNTPVTTAALSGSITLPKAGKTAGEAITIKVKAKNGKSPYKYTYYAIKGSKKTKLASNTKKTSVTWTPSKSGKYTIQVVITDASGKKKTISKTYTVKARVITIKSFKTNKKSGQKVKTKIKLTAKATTKKGKVSYKFAVQKGSGKITTIQKYSKKTSKVWKPTKKGTYKLYVYVKNGKGVTVYKVKTFKIK